VLPDELSRLSFQLRYRGHSLHVDITDDALNVASDPASLDPVTLRFKGETRRLAPGEAVHIALSRNRSSPRNDIRHGQWRQTILLAASG
jgi:trehalose/maltose hydrolase-like predicted phosphorylase